MIKSVTITNYLGESVKITLAEDDPEHGMIISSITGLGPPREHDGFGNDGWIFVQFGKGRKKEHYDSYVLYFCPNH